MIWHRNTDKPVVGSRILVKFKSTAPGNHFETVMMDSSDLNIIEKWCYAEEYQEAIERKLINEKMQEKGQGE